MTVVDGLVLFCLASLLVTVVGQWYALACLRWAIYNVEQQLELLAASAKKTADATEAIMAPKNGTHVTIPLGAALEAFNRVSIADGGALRSVPQSLADEVETVALRTSVPDVDGEVAWETEPPPSIVDIIAQQELEAKTSGAPDRRPSPPPPTRPSPTRLEK